METIMRMALIILPFLPIILPFSSEGAATSKMVTLFS